MWYSVKTNILPPFRGKDYEWENVKSVPVLCRMQSGKITICVLEIVDNGSCQWYENNSEYWNVTSKITHWMPLPEFKE